MNSSEAISIIDKWIPNSTDYYRSKRNYDIDGVQTTSRLSHLISSGLISEMDILLKAYDSGISPTNNKFIEEIFWRIYFRGYFETHPDLWGSYKKSLERDKRSANTKSLDIAIDSKTGIDCFDAWMHQLKENGFLHNHARMWFASIWIFTLNLPWTLGCDLFMRYLVDTDEASNVLSWRWVAGLHTSKKPYIARPDNIKKYTHKYNPNSQLNISPKAIIETNQYSFSPIEFNLNIGSDCSLLMLDNFLEFDPFYLNETKINNFYVLNNSDYNGRRIDKLRLKYRDDIVNSISKKIDIKPKFLDTSDISSLKGKELVTNYQKSGYLNDYLQSVLIDIERIANLNYCNRKIDSLSWNYCKGGYFKLKTHIPAIVDELMNPSLFN